VGSRDCCVRPARWARAALATASTLLLVAAVLATSAHAEPKLVRPASIAVNGNQGGDVPPPVR
jgi:hypothetical protein